MDLYGSCESYDFIVYMNFELWSYKFIKYDMHMIHAQFVTYELIYEMIIWIHGLCEFIYKIHIDHEFMSISIHMQRFWNCIWVHKFTNSDT